MGAGQRGARAAHYVRRSRCDGRGGRHSALLRGGKADHAAAGWRDGSFRVCAVAASGAGRLSGAHGAVSSRAVHFAQNHLQHSQIHPRDASRQAASPSVGHGDGHLQRQAEGNHRRSGGRYGNHAGASVPGNDGEHRRAASDGRLSVRARLANGASVAGGVSGGVRVHDDGHGQLCWPAFCFESTGICLFRTRR